MIFQLKETLKYWLIDHPSIVWFRWSPTQSWGGTWPFLVTAIAAYITAALTLHIILKIFKRSQAVRLGPIPAIHYLMMSLISITIFSGMLFSAAAELHDTRWLLRRTKTTPFEWFLCFPLGMRPSGRVFFWLFNNSILLISSFLWLEFSQSFQVLGILLSTLVYCLVYGYRFWIEIGLPSKNFYFTVNCQMILLGCNLVCHFGVLWLHLWRGGCNGIGAWVFNSVLNAAILFLFLKSYVNVHCQKKNNSTYNSTCDQSFKLQ
ncbi:putative ELO family protein [Medicago truncatula]|uniref:Putative ELO family protein n=1 Tax=Medicago truncatula TaxID=3880 RepID=A0A396JM73_MEDTR|nr:putative ELO family protein [Medicago truncatula]